MQTKQPNAGHNLFMEQASAMCARFEANGISKIEQIALLGQLIGHLISDLDGTRYSTGPVLSALMENVVAGNDAAGALVGLAMGGNI